MKLSKFRAVALAGSAVLLMAGCASDPPKESGFLKNYSELHKEDAPGGGTRLVYTNPQFTPARYSAVMLEPILFYPEPQPTEQASMATLNQIRDYTNKSLRDKFSQKVRVVDKAGPGVARIRIAITAVGSEDAALKAYQYIPIAFVVTAAMAGIEGGRPQDASIALESQVTDSVTGQLLYASVRGGTGERIKSETQGKGTVQAADLEPLIDGWTTAAASEVGKYVVSK